MFPTPSSFHEPHPFTFWWGRSLHSPKKNPENPSPPTLIRPCSLMSLPQSPYPTLTSTDVHGQQCCHMISPRPTPHPNTLSQTPITHPPKKKSVQFLLSLYLFCMCLEAWPNVDLGISNSSQAPTTFQEYASALFCHKIASVCISWKQKVQDWRPFNWNLGSIIFIAHIPVMGSFCNRCIRKFDHRVVPTIAFMTAYRGTSQLASTISQLRFNFYAYLLFFGVLLNSPPSHVFLFFW